MQCLLNQGLKLLVQLFPESDIFLPFILFWLQLKDKPTCVVYSRFVYTDRWPSSPKSKSTKALFILFFFLLHCCSAWPLAQDLNLPPLTLYWSSSLSFKSSTSLWGWDQGFQVKLTPASLASHYGPGLSPCPAVPRVVYMALCQVRLLPWPLYCQKPFGYRPF